MNDKTLRLPMMRVAAMIAMTVTLACCTQKELWYGGGSEEMSTEQIRVAFDWQGQTIPDGMMRVNLFSQTKSMPNYGVADFPADAGGTVQLPQGTTYYGICYSYNAYNQIYFRNENDTLLLEAYTPSMSRTSYTRTFPEEQTVSSVVEGALLGVGEVTNFNVSASRSGDETQVITFVPDDILRRYTFEIDHITGAEYISDCRAALSGMSSSYFPCTGKLSDSPVTLFFGATNRAGDSQIIGSFNTFGRLGVTNNFTLEVLTKGGNILQYTWDVTSQAEAENLTGNDTVIHLVMDGEGKVIIPDEEVNSDGGGAFHTDVDDWDEERVDL